MRFSGTLFAALVGVALAGRPATADDLGASIDLTAFDAADETASDQADLPLNDVAPGFVKASTAAWFVPQPATRMSMPGR